MYSGLGLPATMIYFQLGPTLKNKLALGLSKWRPQTDSQDGVASFKYKDHACVGELLNYFPIKLATFFSFLIEF